MALAAGGALGGHHRGAGVAGYDAVSEDAAREAFRDSVKEMSRRPRTIRESLAALREARDRGEEWTQIEDWVRTRRRMEVLEKVLPAWLEFTASHPLRRAIQSWPSEEYALLIGRAMVYPEEPDYHAVLQHPEALWHFAQAGLGGNPERKGRPSKLSTEDQILIYDLWSHGISTQAQLAEQFKVGIATIKRVIARWRPAHNM